MLKHIIVEEAHVCHVTLMWSLHTFCHDCRWMQSINSNHSALSLQSWRNAASSVRSMENVSTIIKNPSISKIKRRSLNSLTTMPSVTASQTVQSFIIMYFYLLFWSCRQTSSLYVKCWGSVASTGPIPAFCATKEAGDYSRPLSSILSATQSSPSRGKAQVKHDKEPLTVNPVSFHCANTLRECISWPEPSSPTQDSIQEFSLFRL